MTLMALRSGGRSGFAIALVFEDAGARLLRRDTVPNLARYRATQ
jgi:hypothetical protein